MSWIGACCFYNYLQDLLIQITTKLPILEHIFPIRVKLPTTSSTLNSFAHLIGLFHSTFIREKKGCRQ